MAFPGSLTPSLVSSGLSFSQLQASGISGMLETLLANQAATLAPTVACTLAATADGSSTLTTGTYYVCSSETNAFGETTVGPVSSGQAITSGTNHLTITPPALKTGNTARNYYVSAVSNTGPWTLAITGSTGSTATITAPLPTNSYAVGLPASNSTAPAYVDGGGATYNKAVELARGFRYGNGQRAWDYAAREVNAFLRGEPTDFAALIQKVRHSRAALMMAVQCLNEIGTLIDANAGTLYNSTDPIGNSKKVRQWP